MGDSLSVGFEYLDVGCRTDCLDAFKSKLQESGKVNSTFDSKAFFTPSSRLTLTTPLAATQSESGLVKLPGSEGLRVPPRLLSDQMINVYFQEWAPLFPVLHRPTFLKMYADYVANPASIKDPHSIAQLHLVFGIAALSSEVRRYGECYLAHFLMNP